MILFLNSLSTARYFILDMLQSPSLTERWLYFKAVVIHNNREQDGDYICLVGTAVSIQTFDIYGCRKFVAVVPGNTPKFQMANFLSMRGARRFLPLWVVLKAHGKHFDWWYWNSWASGKQLMSVFKGFILDNTLQYANRTSNQTSVDFGKMRMNTKHENIQWQMVIVMYVWC